MDYGQDGQDGQACRQTFIYRITEGFPVCELKAVGRIV